MACVFIYQSKKTQGPKVIICDKNIHIFYATTLKVCTKDTKTNIIKLSHETRLHNKFSIQHCLLFMVVEQKIQKPYRNHTHNTDRTNTPNLINEMKKGPYHSELLFSLIAFNQPGNLSTFLVILQQASIRCVAHFETSPRSTVRVLAPFFTQI